MANTPESPFDKINKLLQQQNFLNEQQSKEMQTAINTAVQDFPNKLAAAQSELNKNTGTIMAKFNEGSAKINSEIANAGKNLSISPSQAAQFQSQLNTGIAGIRAQSTQLSNFKIPNVAGATGQAQSLLAGSAGDIQNAISNVNFGQMNQAIAQGTQALGASLQNADIQNAINSAKGQLATGAANLPDLASQLSGTLQSAGIGNSPFPVNGLSADQLGRLTQDLGGQLEGVAGALGDQLGPLSGQLQELGSQLENGFKTAGISVGSGASTTAGAEQRALSKTKVNLTSQPNQGMNKLHNFEIYTYRFTLYLLTKEELDSVYLNPRLFNPKHVLISSGGSYSRAMGTDSTGRARLPDFEEDFFIEDLDMQTIVGLNSKSKSSNAVDINFTIYEPYGVTLLDRLLSVCETVAKCPNYIQQPYLLEIDFLANPTGDIGKVESVLIDRKRIPLKIMEMAIKPDLGGTEYRCRAIPFNHSGLLNTVASVPATLGVVAGTVGEFFSDEPVPADATEKNEERADADLKEFLKKQPFGGAGFSKRAKEQKRQEFLQQYVTKIDSFPVAYNNYFKAISGDGQGKTFKYPPALIAFKIDDEIKNSKIVFEEETDSRTTKMTDLDQDLRSTTKGAVLSYGKTKQEFPVSAGTNVLQLIDKVIMKSSYIVNQAKNSKQAIEAFEQAKKDGDKKAVRAAEAKAKEYKYLDWFKVIPHVSLLEFDESRNAYAVKVTYHIKKYKTANQHHPDFALTRITKDKIVRSYDYLYTGNSKDIIDLSIDFDSTYYTQITAFHGSKQRAGSKLSSKTGSDNDPTLLDNQSADAPDGDANRGADLPTTYQSRSANSSNAGQLNRQDSAVSQSVNDLASSIYTSQRGDMLNLRVGIIGDPDFIKQDDLYINPESSEYQGFVGSSDNSPINSEFGTISFDSQQVYVQLMFKSAVDIDDELGITNKGLKSGGGKAVKLSNGRELNGTFNGVYKVLTVTNKFNSGEFTQVLDIIKMPNEMLESTEVEPDNNAVTITDDGQTAKKGLLADDIAAQTSANNDGGAPATTSDETAEQQGIFQQDIDRLAPALNSPPESGDTPVEGIGVAEGRSVAFNQTAEQRRSIIEANRQITTARPDNINNTAFVQNIGSQAPSGKNKGIFAGDIPSTENLG